MLKFYVKASETLRQLRSDETGVVSFEYIIVATCIVATVVAVFAAGGNNTISGALSTGIAQHRQRHEPLTDPVQRGHWVVRCPLISASQRRLAHDDTACAR